MKLKNKVALITGSSRGIGKATALLFAREGSKIVVNYKSSKKEAENIVKKIGKNAFAVYADVSQEKDVKSLTSIRALDLFENHKTVYFIYGDSGRRKSLIELLDSHCTLILEPTFLSLRSQIFLRDILLPPLKSC